MVRLQENINCAIINLDKAIKLHEIHLKDPSTATPPSQEEMMVYMMDAYKCLNNYVKYSKLSIL